MPYRGNPDPHEDVHYMATIDGKEEPLCRTGAWNIRYTKINTNTTCKACIARMKTLGMGTPTDSEGLVFNRNGQTVTCYGECREDSNFAAVFDDKEFDGVVADVVSNGKWSVAVDQITAYARRVGTTLIELSAV